MEVLINSRKYSSVLSHIPFDVENQIKRIKHGRVVIDYDLTHSETSKIKFWLNDDDGNKIVHTVYVNGKGRQELDGLFYTHIEIDEHFENTKIYQVVKELS